MSELITYALGIRSIGCDVNERFELASMSYIGLNNEIDLFANDLFWKMLYTHSHLFQVKKTGSLVNACCGILEQHIDKPARKLIPFQYDSQTKDSALLKRFGSSPLIDILPADVKITNTVNLNYTAVEQGLTTLFDVWTSKHFPILKLISDWKTKSDLFVLKLIPFEKNTNVMEFRHIMGLKTFLMSNYSYDTILFPPKSEKLANDIYTAIKKYPLLIIMIALDLLYEKPSKWAWGRTQSIPSGNKFRIIIQPSETITLSDLGGSLPKMRFIQEGGKIFLPKNVTLDNNIKLELKIPKVTENCNIFEVLKDGISLQLKLYQKKWEIFHGNELVVSESGKTYNLNNPINFFYLTLTLDPLNIKNIFDNFEIVSHCIIPNLKILAK